MKVCSLRGLHVTGANRAAGFTQDRYRLVPGHPLSITTTRGVSVHRVSYCMSGPGTVYAYTALLWPWHFSGAMRCVIVWTGVVNNLMKTDKRQLDQIPRLTQHSLQTFITRLQQNLVSKLSSHLCKKNVNALKIYGASQPNKKNVGKSSQFEKLIKQLNNLC